MTSRSIPLMLYNTYANSIMHSSNNDPVGVLEFGPLPPIDIDNTATIQTLLMTMSHYLQQLLINQGDQERIARRRRKKGNERSEGQHKFKGVRHAMVLGTRKGHVPEHLLNKKV